MRVLSAVRSAPWAVLLAGLAGAALAAASPAPRKTVPPRSDARTASATTKKNPFLVPSRPRRPQPAHTPVPKGKRVQATLKNAAAARAAAVIRPKLAGGRPARFELARTGTGVFLRFTTSDPDLELSRNGTLAVQLLGDEPLEVEPELVLAEDWWKAGGKQLALRVTGGAPDLQHRVMGEASYVVCSRKTKKCRRELGSFLLQ